MVLARGPVYILSHLLATNLRRCLENAEFRELFHELLPHRRPHFGSIVAVSAEYNKYCIRGRAFAKSDQDREKETFFG
jgi:hypothetical protein